MNKAYYSQNFLHDHQVIERIVTCINPQKTDAMLEIGPGAGALTQFLVPQVHQFMAIEIDKVLIEPLIKKFNAYPYFRLIQEDILRFKLVDNPWITTYHPIRIVGNLPYHISTPLLFHLFKAKKVIQDMHFMLQKEVVDRIVAQPGSKTYGRLSVMCQYHCQVKALFNVAKEAFNPIPQVESSILHCIPHASLPYPALNYGHFAQLVNTVFQHRRKTLKNALKMEYHPSLLKTLGIDPQVRPETLSVAQYVMLSNEICENLTT